MANSQACSWFTLGNICHSGEQGCKANDLWRQSSQKEDRKMEVITSKLK